MLSPAVLFLFTLLGTLEICSAKLYLWVCQHKPKMCNLVEALKRSHTSGGYKERRFTFTQVSVLYKQRSEGCVCGF